MCLEHVWKIFKYFKLIMQKSCFLLSLLARVPGKLLLNSRENFEINKTCNTFLGGEGERGSGKGDTFTYISLLHKLSEARTKRAHCALQSSWIMCVCVCREVHISFSFFLSVFLPRPHCISAHIACGTITKFALHVFVYLFYRCRRKVCNKIRSQKLRIINSYRYR